MRLREKLEAQKLQAVLTLLYELDALQKASPPDHQGIDRLEAELDFLLSEDIRISIRKAQEGTAAARTSGRAARLRSSLLQRLGLSPVATGASGLAHEDLARVAAWIRERAKRQ